MRNPLFIDEIQEKKMSKLPNHTYLFNIPIKMWNAIIRAAEITGRSRRLIILELIEDGIKYRLQKKKARELANEEDYFN